MTFHLFSQKKKSFRFAGRISFICAAVGRSGSGMGIGFARFLRYPPAASVAVSVSFHKRDEHPDPSGFGDLDAFPPQNCKNLMFQFIHDRTPRIRDPARLLMFRRSFRVIIDIVFDPPELVARGCKCLCQTGFAAVLRIPLTDVLRRPFRIWFKFHNQYGFLRRFVLVCHASCLPSFPKNRFPLGRAQPALPYGKIKL